MLPFYQINNTDIYIISADTIGNYTVSLLTELLPHGYLTSSNLDVIEGYKNINNDY